MTDGDEKYYKLTSELNRQHYWIKKWVNQEHNVYCETKEYYRKCDVYLDKDYEFWEHDGVVDNKQTGLWSYKPPKLTYSGFYVIGELIKFEVEADDKFELDFIHFHHVDGDSDGITQANANQRRNGEDYPIPDSKFLEECEELMVENNGNEDELEGWEKVGTTIGWSEGTVTVEKVEEGDIS